MAGRMVEFPSNGRTIHGYLATPAQGRGPGVVVIQEWWGLVGHIKHVCDRFAAECFSALAPDLYHAKVASEPDEANKLFMALRIGEAEKDLAGAAKYLAATGPQVSRLAEEGDWTILRRMREARGGGARDRDDGPEL